jgi:hypothetical protein
MRKRQVISLAICLCLGIAPYALAAASYDGSVPLLCAVIEVFDCQGGGECQRGTAESVNLPQFLKINVQDKTLTTTGEGESKRSTPIKHLERTDDSLILQGVEGSRAWSMIIAKETGKTSATVSDDHVGFVVFGACTPY